VVLPDGRLLLALGEAGVRMLSREGKTIVQFDQPAERIVISDHGDRAIVVAPRGEISRTARIDLVKRRAERWFDATLTQFADSFDGSMWLVSTLLGGFAVDALEETFQSIWDFKGLACILSVRSTNAVIFRVGAEAWTFDLPSFRLRPLCRFPQEKGVKCLRLGPNGTSICWFGEKTTDTWTWAPAIHHEPAETWNSLEEPSPECPFYHATIDALGHHGVFGRLIDDCCVSKVFDLREKKLRFEIELHGATHVRARFQAGNLILVDDRGRVLVVNLERNKIVGEWRI
jgi:hypothetical protein